jgi:LysM repeat protein
VRKFIFKNEVTDKELLLPVTPPSFEVSHGINIETINIHKVGDVVIPGYETLQAIRIDCMFPSKKYPFNQPGTNLDPYYYVNKFKTWCDKHRILRFIVSGTPVNVPVLISDITYGEKDGTGDVYASINMREYRELSIIPTDKTGNKSRDTKKDKKATKSYIVKSGDTLSTICRKHYGNTSICQKVATYNGIKNINLIYAGNAIKLPDVSLL